MKFKWTRSGLPLGRDDRLFREAMRRLTQEIDAIFHRHAAAGHLKSGATIKALVRAMDDTTATAVNDALSGIAAVTEHSGRKRKRLIDELTKSVGAHHQSATDVIQIAVERIGLGADFEHAAPLIELAKQRHDERISDFAEGWTAPLGRRWTERHPIAFALVSAIFGAALGTTATKIVDQVVFASDACTSRE